MTGLITDKFWVLIRSDQTSRNVENLVDSQMSPQFVEENLHIGVYRADFNGKAYRYRLLSDK